MLLIFNNSIIDRWAVAFPCFQTFRTIKFKKYISSYLYTWTFNNQVVHFVSYEGCIF